LQDDDGNVLVSGDAGQSVATAHGVTMQVRTLQRQSRRAHFTVMQSFAHGATITQLQKDIEAVGARPRTPASSS
jgi:hypothetical protein